MRASSRHAVGTNPAIFPHVRMPVVLPPTDREAWLDPSGQDVERLQSLLCPYPAEEMTAYPVSTRVNNLAHDTPECIARLA